MAEEPDLFVGGFFECESGRSVTDEEEDGGGECFPDSRHRRNEVGLAFAVAECPDATDQGSVAGEIEGVAGNRRGVGEGGEFDAVGDDFDVVGGNVLRGAVVIFDGLGDGDEFGEPLVCVPVKGDEPAGMIAEIVETVFGGNFHRPARPCTEKVGLDEMGVEDVGTESLQESTQPEVSERISFVPGSEVDGFDAGILECQLERGVAVEVGNGGFAARLTEGAGEGEELAFRSANVEFGDEVEDAHGGIVVGGGGSGKEIVV